MTPFTTLVASVAPLDRANVDTDAILPKQFMKSIRRTGFADNLFDAWRYLDPGEPGKVDRTPNPGFVLNRPACAAAQVLLARENFGCGSSREHAVWALRDFGFRAVVAPSFADIFFGNCFKNGVLPIAVDAAVADRWFERLAREPAARLRIDLPAQTLQLDGEPEVHFDIDASRKHRLLQGLDDIALTLQLADRIRAYEARRRLEEPWLFERARVTPG